MCGIVGYVGRRPCRDLLVAGLEKLEYRGYDSAGISLLANGQIDSVRAVGNLSKLRAAIAAEMNGGGPSGGDPAAATIGVAHTRWATHGRVTEVLENPASDVLVLDRGPLVPLRFATWDDDGRLVVDGPEGLLDAD